MQRLADLQAVARHHRGQRPAVAAAVPAGPSRVPEGGGHRPGGRAVLEGGSGFQFLDNGGEMIPSSATGLKPDLKQSTSWF